MKALIPLSLAAVLMIAPQAWSQPRGPVRADALASHPAHYRVEISGAISEGPGGVVREDAAIQVNVIMRNALVIGMRADRRGVLSNAQSPASATFRRTITGEGAYVTTLDQVAAVEVIHFFNGAPPHMDEPDLRAMHRKPEQWFFDGISLSARLFRKNPVTGVEVLVEEREIFNARPQRMMRYGIWASARLPDRLEPPPAIHGSEGHAAITVLTGADGMKTHPAVAEALIDTSAGTVRLSAQTLLLSAHRLWRAPSPQLVWNGLGRVGLRYRYGDHGPFDRDDWEIKAVLVDFCTRFATGVGACFRKGSHYLFGRDNASIATLNGDGAGTEIWEPFIAGRR